jgi:hypothetical protein
VRIIYKFKLYFLNNIFNNEYFNHKKVNKINVITESNNEVKQRENANNNNSQTLNTANHNITKLVITMIIIHYFGYIPFTLSPFFDESCFFFDIILIFLLIGKSLNFFVYYNSNSDFRKIIRDYLRRVRLSGNKLYNCLISNR